jgi:hypothetical protein
MQRAKRQMPPNSGDTFRDGSQAIAKKVQHALIDWLFVGLEIKS